MSMPQQRIITAGRAYVRLAEASDALLDYRPAWTEALLLRLVRMIYRRRLRSLVAALPPNVSAEILAVSEIAENGEKKPDGTQADNRKYPVLRRQPPHSARVHRRREH